MITISINDNQLIIDSQGQELTGINAARPFHNFVDISKCSFTPDAIHNLLQASDSNKSLANVGIYVEGDKTYFFWRGEKQQSLNVKYLRQLAGTDWDLLPK
ncbi:hypothetical protein OTK49_00980 [Vibrio coralliirubri]|uniref:hypothetical protein n=1 Tax=Vibrio coralliirubri TaxID=1516159 RepID=UPI002284F4B4|nr:hypothetical protein [Vibrio coralliirubri]MCY9861104.1 hypothetical protein [Vibrio coralliirubri]